MKLLDLIKLFIYFLIHCGTISASFEFGGYIYNFPSVQIINNETGLYTNDYNSILIDLTRLRLKPSFYFSEDTRIEMNYEINAIISKSHLPLISNIQVTNRQALNLNWQLLNSEYVKINHFIDLLYFKHLFEFGEFTIGRQFIAWGVGRIWQPTDLFNPLNPANFSKIEKDGIDAINAKIYLGSFSDIDIISNFSNNFKKVHFGTRFRTNFLENDLSLVAGMFDENYILGGSIAGNLFNAGIRTEVIYSINEQSNSKYFRGIVGVDYQFSDKLYSALEYQFNEAGASDKMDYLKLFDKLFKGEIQNISRNYVGAVVNYLFSPIISANIISIANLNDMSAMFLISTKYELFQSFYLSAGVLYTLGDKFTEYWYYNDALFLTIEYYF